MILFITSCTFDYGEATVERETPDLVMENVEYVRVRSSDPIARFTAERAERYEKQGVMKLKNFTFEQYGERGEEVNAIGGAGYASVDIETGDVFMDNGVWLEVESEDIILETKQLDWKDEPRLLYSGPEDEVNIFQSSGTDFKGIGLYVEARNRIWEFKGNVSGTFISVDEEDEESTVRVRREPRTFDTTHTASVRQPETTDQRPVETRPPARQPQQDDTAQQTPVQQDEIRVVDITSQTPPPPVRQPEVIEQKPEEEKIVTEPEEDERRDFDEEEHEHK